MNYSPEEFARLEEEIEKQGGTLLAEVCVPQDIAFKAPPYNKAHTERRVTAGCWNEARFAIPYDPEPKSTQNVGVVTACACDDNISSWPRFRKVLK